MHSTEHVLSVGNKQGEFSPWKQQWIFLSWVASEENTTNEETDRSPDDVSYHLADKQCRKNSQELQPRADKQCRKKSHKPFPRRNILYHQDYQEAKNTSAYPPRAKHHHTGNSHHDLDSEDDMILRYDRILTSSTTSSPPRSGSVFSAVYLFQI